MKSTRGFHRQHYLGEFVVLIGRLVAVYGYLCLPRVWFSMWAQQAEMNLTWGFWDQTLAWASVLLALYYTLALVVPRAATRTILVCLHVEFAFRALEAGLIYSVGIGYSPLFFQHFTLEAVRVALISYWQRAGFFCGIGLVAHVSLLRLFAARERYLGRPARLAALLVIVFGLRSIFVLYRERERLPQDFPLVAFSYNLRTYWRRPHVEDPPQTEAERAFIQDNGLAHRVRGPSQMSSGAQFNLVTIYLEGFQKNFTAAGDSPFQGLTPQLDRFAARFTRFDSFYNAVTPTINSLVSSQCGILSQLVNSELDVDRGYTRDLECLPDVLHAAGYYQVFMGGANSGFSGKRRFLATHHFDEVWGWENWQRIDAYESGRRHAWGLHDTDLVREAIDRLEGLRRRAPFHLSLLTVNTHPPGFIAPDCAPYPSNQLIAAVHCTDEAIGRLLTALEIRGFLADTVVVVMGDHMMFPSAENAVVLGSASTGWYGKVVMALSVPATSPNVIEQPSYTPDFAPIVLDALGLASPPFPFGRSAFRSNEPRAMLVAPNFALVGGQIIPFDPEPGEPCGSEHRPIFENVDDALATPCGRERILGLIAKDMTRH